MTREQRSELARLCIALRNMMPNGGMVPAIIHTAKSEPDKVSDLVVRTVIARYFEDLKQRGQDGEYNPFQGVDQDTVTLRLMYTRYLQINIVCLPIISYV